MRSCSERMTQNLIMALLAVANYTLEEVYNHREGFEREGIFDVDQVNDWNAAQTSRRLVKAGYDRGTFMNSLLADRLLSLCDFLGKGGLDVLSKACETRSLDEVAKVMKGVRGVGPIVLRNFAILMDWKLDWNERGS